MIPGSANPLLLATAAGAAEEGISRSLRFNSSDSAYLSRTPASAGNRKTWTWAGWVKRTNPQTSIRDSLFSTPSGTNDSTLFNLIFLDDKIYVAGSATGWRLTSAVFRDPSAWYHIVLAVDTTQSTANNRIRLYINGAEVTAFSTLNNPSQNADLGINNTIGHTLGSYGAAYFNGYLADIHFIDGQALDPTSFGEFDDNGIWQPKAYSGSYGTNGFHLPFSDNSTAAALGTDTSGNGNTWTVNNLSVADGTTTVAAATGALPIYNTTDTYGATKGSGTRTDSNSSSIVLALPMDGTNNGTTFTDESATIKGSGSAKSITRNGDTKTSTTQSKFYGSSGYFDGTDDYLSVPTNADFGFGTGDYTIEYWYYSDKAPGAETFIWDTRAGTNNQPIAYYNTSGTLLYYFNGTNRITISNAWGQGRWQHHAFVRSGTSIKAYIDGVEAGSVTGSFTHESTAKLVVGGSQSGNGLITGYIQDFRIYKGVAKYTSNFNPPSSTQNTTIAAGNDSLVDVPTNGTETDTGLGGEVRGNYATLNPLFSDFFSSAPTYSNGNLDLTQSSDRTTFGTIAVSSGKWYWEITIASGTNQLFGITDTSKVGIGTGTYNQAGSYYYYPAVPRKYVNGSFSSYGSTVSVGDVVGVALDLDAGEITFYKNNVSQGVMASSLPAATYVPGFGAGNTTACAQNINFGQRPFAYTAPSGFKALNTANLPAPVVTKPSEYMDVKLYTGNGSTQTISGLGFSPDLVWIKSRDVARLHQLYDQIRGATKVLSSESTNAESTESQALTAFTSDGFTVGSNNGVNGNNELKVAWTWDAGSSTVTNTQGSISSQVRANASAGFSVVTYTGTGVAGSFGHGLNVSPGLVIIKKRTGDMSKGYWTVYHSGFPSVGFMELNVTAAFSADTTKFSSVPSSTVINIGNNSNVNQSGQGLVAYCFAPVAGYSSFGSYTGNGSADGPFVYTGFRPRWVMIKRSDSASVSYGWFILDTARNTYNVMNTWLAADSSAADGADVICDALSNGFKVRTTAGNINTNAGTFVWAAFAESPFNFSRAR